MPGARDALVVDDDESIRSLVSAMLSRAGYGVRAYGDPQEALLAATECPPDLYVLDVRLPGMNGRELCRVLKAGGRTRKPVLMISAEASVDDVEAAFGAGCDDFLAKPFRRSELVARVDDLRG